MKVPFGVGTRGIVYIVLAEGKVIYFEGIMSEGWDVSAGPRDMRGTRCDFVAKGAKRCSTIWHAAAGPQALVKIYGPLGTPRYET